MSRVLSVGDGHGAADGDQVREKREKRREKRREKKERRERREREKREKREREEVPHRIISSRLPGSETHTRTRKRR